MQAALDKLKRHPGPEARMMRTAGEQASRCEQAGLVPHVPANRSVNNQGDGTLLDRSAFVYLPGSDSFLCPADKTLKRKQLLRHKRTVSYQADPADCGTCAVRPHCTEAGQRMLSRHLDEGALHRMHQRATPERVRLRRPTVGHPSERSSTASS